MEVQLAKGGKNVTVLSLDSDTFVVKDASLYR